MAISQAMSELATMHCAEDEGLEGLEEMAF